MRQVDIYPLRKRDQKHRYRFSPNYRNFLLMVFRNISKINGADTLTPSEINLKGPPRNRLFKAFREWSNCVWI